MDDNTMLLAVRQCLSSPMDCQKCPLLHDDYCRPKTRKWLDEFMERQLRQEDDGK